MEEVIGKARRLFTERRAPDLSPPEPKMRAARPAFGSMAGSQTFPHIIRVLLKRRRLILTMAIVGGAGAGMIGWMVPSSYTATAQMIVDQRPFEVDGRAVPISQAVEEAAIDTHVTMLTSDAHLRRVVEAMRATTEEAATEPPSLLRRIGGGLANLWALATRPLRRAEADGPSEAGESSALADLKRNLRVSQERRSRIITVIQTASRPDRAAEIANTVADVHVEDLTQRKRLDAERLVAWLSKRLPEMRREVARAEEDLEAYRLVRGSTTGAGPDETGQQIAQMVRQLALAKSDAAAAQERLNRINDLRRRGAPAATVALALGLGPTAEPTREEIDRAVSRLETEHRTYLALAKSIEERLLPLKGAATEIAAGLSDLRALERQAAAVAQLYDTLLRRQQEATEQAQLVQPDIRVLARAWPPNRPNSLHPLFLVPPGMIAFAIMGGLLAVGLDRLDRSLHDEGEALETLAIPCAGQVPKIEPWQAKRLHELMRRQPQAPFVRAVRSLLVSVLPVSTGNPMQKVVLVTSSVPGEGKTTLARSLALSAARLHLRVLLLDLGPQTAVLENRAPTISGVPRTDLVDILGYGRPLADAIERIPELGLDYIPPSRLDGDLLDLLANPQVPILVNQLREAYDL
ncbi:MAG: GumC family protein, partial [Phreatobacter sp.]